MLIIQSCKFLDNRLQLLHCGSYNSIHSFWIQVLVRTFDYLLFLIVTLLIPVTKQSIIQGFVYYNVCAIEAINSSCTGVPLHSVLTAQRSSSVIGL